MVLLLGNDSLTLDQDICAAGFPEAEQRSDAVLVTLTVSFEEEIVTFGSEMDYPGSPLIPGIPGIPGGSISPLVPFSPIIPGGPMIPCFPLLPGGPMIPLFSSLSLPSLVPFRPCFPRRSRPATRTKIQIAFVVTNLQTGRNDVFYYFS